MKLRRPPMPRVSRVYFQRSQEPLGPFFVPALGCSTSSSRRRRNSACGVRSLGYRARARLEASTALMRKHRALSFILLLLSWREAGAPDLSVSCQCPSPNVKGFFRQNQEEKAATFREEDNIQWHNRALMNQFGQG